MVNPLRCRARFRGSFDPPFLRGLGGIFQSSTSQPIAFKTSSYTKQKKKEKNEQVDQQLDEVVEAIAQTICQLRQSTPP